MSSVVQRPHARPAVPVGIPPIASPPTGAPSRVPRAPTGGAGFAVGVAALLFWVLVAFMSFAVATIVMVS